MAPDPRAWGIEPGFHDAHGTWREAPPDTVEAALAALGADTERPPRPPVVVVVAGRPVETDGDWHLTFEDGTTRSGSGTVDTASAPLGYHRLDDGSGTRQLVVTPGRCHVPPGLRQWGWAAQLYATRSRRSWGMGDLRDADELARWSRHRGAGFLLLNPLHHAPPTQPSPYYPSSRTFRNPLYLAVDGDPPPDLRAATTIDRESVWRAKEPALRAQADATGGAAAFAAYRQEQGDALHRFATHEALAAHHGGPWPTWPEAFARADSPAVAAFVAAHGDEVRFHEWLQWQLDEQLAALAGTIDVVHDLAVGCDPAGVDTWLWPDAFVGEWRVGAPPDEFNQQGQDWGLPPFHPMRLAESGYGPFVAMLRQNLRHAAGLRVDHVMGLFRLFWIPPGGSPTDGVYVRYPSEDLLGILALESHRAGAWIVGEDLGTVEDRVRHDLAECAVLSYRLLWFEDRTPDQWPHQAMAAVTTHDLPTVAGLWSGLDLEELDALGLDPNREATQQIVDRLTGWFGLGRDAPTSQVSLALHRALTAAPSMVVTATLEDLAGARRRPNVPGTTDERPNWRLPLPALLEDLLAAPEADALAAALGSSDRRTDTDAGT